nr:basic salivary proline-rich protein 1-like [Procambarus clarkii]
MRESHGTKPRGLAPKEGTERAEHSPGGRSTECHATWASQPGRVPRNRPGRKAGTWPQVVADGDTWPHSGKPSPTGQPRDTQQTGNREHTRKGREGRLNTPSRPDTWSMPAWHGPQGLCPRVIEPPTPGHVAYPLGATPGRPQGPRQGAHPGTARCEAPRARTGTAGWSLHLGGNRTQSTRDAAQHTPALSKATQQAQHGAPDTGPKGRPCTPGQPNSRKPEGLAKAAHTDREGTALGTRHTGEVLTRIEQKNPHLGDQSVGQEAPARSV